MTLIHRDILRVRSVGIAEFAGLENDELENDGLENEETYILHTIKWTQTNVYDT